MGENKSSISHATSYQEIGEYWDTHDLAEVWEQTEPADFEVDLQSEQIYYRIDRELADQVTALAQARGISAETLLNLWVQEKLQQPDVLRKA
jgi:hypothetical protein